MKFDKLIKKKLEKSLNENGYDTIIATDDNPIKMTRFPRQRISSKDGHLNYPLVGRRFHEDDISPKAKESKKYINKITDSDILELNQRPWVISTNAKENIKPELKTTLFEVN